jgi:hypothetical protein
MAKNKGVPKLSQTLETRDLPHFVRAYVMLYQKEIDSTTGTGNQPKTPEADDADTGALKSSMGPGQQ